MSEGAKGAKEIIYELLLLTMEIFYTMNKEIFKEVKRIFCCKKEDNESQIEDEEEKPSVPLK